MSNESLIEKLEECLSLSWESDVPRLPAMLRDAIQMAHDLQINTSDKKTEQLYGLVYKCLAGTGDIDSTTWDIINTLRPYLVQTKASVASFTKASESSSLLEDIRYHSFDSGSRLMVVELTKAEELICLHMGDEAIRKDAKGTSAEVLTENISSPTKACGCWCPIHSKERI